MAFFAAFFAFFAIGLIPPFRLGYCGRRYRATAMHLPPGTPLACAGPFALRCAAIDDVARAILCSRSRAGEKAGQFNDVKPPLLRRPYFFFAFLAFLAAFFAFFAIVPPEGGRARASVATREP